jgi:hypothetical protein
MGKYTDSLVPGANAKVSPDPTPHEREEPETYASQGMRTTKPAATKGATGAKGATGPSGSTGQGGLPDPSLGYPQPKSPVPPLKDAEGHEYDPDNVGGSGVSGLRADYQKDQATRADTPGATGAASTTVIHRTT